MLKLSCENDLYLHENEKSWAYQRLRHRKNKTNKISGKEWNKKIWQNKSNTKIGQKIERYSRTKNHTKRSNKKTSDNKLGQKIRRKNQPKIGHINSDKIVGNKIEQDVGQNIEQKNQTKKSNKASHKFGQKIGQKTKLKAVKKFRQISDKEIEQDIGQ